MQLKAWWANRCGGNRRVRVAGTRPWSSRALATGLMLGATLVWFVPAGQTATAVLSPYSSFQAMSLADMATLQVKLTYVGPSDEMLSSVLFVSTTGTPSVSGFVPFRRSSVNYASDDHAPLQTFHATNAELKAVIDDVATLPAVTAGGVTQPAHVSFALYNSVGGAKVFESVTDLSQAVSLFAQLRTALAGNAVGLAILDEMACALATLDPARPTDRSTDVSVVLSSIRLDRKTGHFVGRATVQNTTGSSISGPVSLVFAHAASGYRLANRSGTTCGLSPAGQDYLNLTLPGGVLAPGSPVIVKLEFENPDRLLIRTAVSVLAGPGAR